MIKLIDRSDASEGGFTLLELVITLVILTVLTLGAIPLLQASVKRHREERLRETLREIRSAIDHFQRDTVGSPCALQQGATGQTTSPPPPVPTQPGGQVPPQTIIVDPRSRVVITDCTIFSTDNPDRYPPDLETLVNGVNVAPRTAFGRLGGAGLTGSTRTATEEGALALKKKIYLREIPVDPMTGRREWRLRSLYDQPDSSWGGENVFDVRSTSDGTALNGEKYSDW